MTKNYTLNLESTRVHTILKPVIIQMVLPYLRCALLCGVVSDVWPLKSVNFLSSVQCRRHFFRYILYVYETGFGLRDSNVYIFHVRALNNIYIM
jgi:hypothetical protein